MAVGFHGFGDWTGLSMGVSGETPDPVPDLLDTAAWLLDLTIGGRVLRYATHEVEVTDVRGRVYLYRSGLTDFPFALDGVQEEHTVKVVDRRVDWALLASRGENLDRATVKLRHWEPGELLEGALEVLEGSVDEPEYGDPDAPAALVLSVRASGTIDVLYPSAQAKVDATTFDNEPGTSGPPTFVAPNHYDEAIEGAVYPTIFGYPGAGDEDTVSPVGATPALLVEYTDASLNSFLMIGAGVVDATTVRLHAPDNWELFGINIGHAFKFQQNRPVIQRTDLLGQVYSAVEIDANDDPLTDPSPWDPFAYPGQRYYVGWSRSSGRGGGVRLPDGSGPVRDLGDIATFVLRNSGRKVDLAAQEAEASALSIFKIDAHINGRMALVPWFDRQLVPLFPILRARSERGMYWRHVKWGATAVDSVAHLDADAGHVTRASSIRSTRDQVANQFTLDFAVGGEGNQARSRRILTASDGVLDTSGFLATDTRIIGSPGCARSQSVYGLIERPAVTTPWVWSTSTAAGILSYWATRDAFPRRMVTYTGRAVEFRELLRGDVVTVTDGEVSLERAVAIVESIRLTSHRLATIDLVVLDPRARV
jgi:hypothetical protein